MKQSIFSSSPSNFDPLAFLLFQLVSRSSIVFLLLIHFLLHFCSQTLSLFFFLPLSLSFSFSRSSQHASGPSEFHQAPQTIHCLGNVVCCLHSPPPPSPSSSSCLAGDNVRWCSAPGSSRPLGLNTLTCLTSGPGPGQLIGLNLVLTRGKSLNNV